MKRAQINLDLLFAYIVFIIFIAYFAGYVLDLFNPFLDYSKSVLVEKNNMVLRNNVITILNLKNANEACNISVPNLSGIEVEYSINTFNMVVNDEQITWPNETKGSILFKREQGSLLVVGGTNSTPINATLVFTMPETGIKYNEINVSAGDSIKYSTDSSNNIIFEVNLSVNSTDRLSGYRIFTSFSDSRYVVVSLARDRTTGQDLFDTIYIGKTKAGGHCREGGETDLKTQFAQYKNLGEESEDFLSFIEVNAWWKLE